MKTGIMRVDGVLPRTRTYRRAPARAQTRTARFAAALPEAIACLYDTCFSCKMVQKRMTFQEEMVLFSGLSPENSFDEALADMITDGVRDLRYDLANIFYEKDEAKKVRLLVRSPTLSLSFFRPLAR